MFFCVSLCLQWRVLLDLSVCLAEEAQEFLSVPRWEDLELVLRFRCVRGGEFIELSTAAFCLIDGAS